MTADNEYENIDNGNIVMVDNLENDNAALENEDRSIEELPGTYPFSLKKLFLFIMHL